MTNFGAWVWSFGETSSKVPTMRVHLPLRDVSVIDTGSIRPKYEEIPIDPSDIRHFSGDQWVKLSNFRQIRMSKILLVSNKVSKAGDQLCQTYSTPYDAIGDLPENKGSLSAVYPYHHLYLTLESTPKKLPVIVPGKLYDDQTGWIFYSNEIRYKGPLGDRWIYGMDIDQDLVPRRSLYPIGYYDKGKEKGAMDDMTLHAVAPTFANQNMCLRFDVLYGDSDVIEIPLERGQIVNVPGGRFAFLKTVPIKERTSPGRGRYIDGSPELKVEKVSEILLVFGKDFIGTFPMVNEEVITDSGVVVPVKYDGDPVLNNNEGGHFHAYKIKDTGDALRIFRFRTRRYHNSLVYHIGPLPGEHDSDLFLNNILNTRVDYIKFKNTGEQLLWLQDTM
jgi:hypothetical protein